MATWSQALPAGKAMLFEVVGKEAAWREFGRIKCQNSAELALGDTIGQRVVVTPAPFDRTVYYTPYHDSGSNVGENQIRPTPSGAGAWIIYSEDASDGDYNDYTVRASISDAVTLGLAPAK